MASPDGRRLLSLLLSAPLSDDSSTGCSGAAEQRPGARSNSTSSHNALRMNLRSRSWCKSL